MATVVAEIPNLVGSLVNVIQQAQAAAKAAAEQSESDYNIRTAFLENTSQKLMDAAQNKINVMIILDTTQDDNSGLNGHLPLDPASVMVSGGRTLTYRVHAFDDGTYTHNEGFGNDMWIIRGRFDRKNNTITHGLHHDPQAVLTFHKP
jgi:hypothetical protein